MSLAVKIFAFSYLVVSTFLIQLHTICEDELQTIVQMGFSQNSYQDLTLQSQAFPGKKRGRKILFYFIFGGGGSNDGKVQHSVFRG